MYTLCCKKIGLIFVFSVLLSRGYAEKNIYKLLGKDNKKISFGIGLGPSYHKLAIQRNLTFITNNAIMNISPAAIPGFSTQSFTYVKLSNHWNFRTIAIVPFFNFSQYQLNIKEVTPEERERIRIIESFKIGLPFDFIFKSDRINNFRFYALGGGYAHYNFFSTKDATIKQDDILVNFNKFDLGLNMGLGFNFYTHYNIVSLELKYNLGLKNLYLRDNSSHVSNAIDNLFTRDLYFYIIIH